MQSTVDDVGRVLIPKALRDQLGLKPGDRVDLSGYGAGLQLIPHGRTARLARENGVLVARSSTKVTDADVFALVDQGRR